MPYATVADLKDAIPPSDLELLTDFERTGVASDARLEKALRDATAEIDSYVGKFVRGLSEVPHILTVLCRDLAMQRLYLNLGHDMETYNRLRSDALSYLRSVRDGKVALGDDDGSQTVESTPGVAMTDGVDRQMTRDRLRGY